MFEFVDDDMRYLDWIKDNPHGFVINSYRNPSQRYLMNRYYILHRATCDSISSQKARNHTSGEYLKICSLDIAKLEQWVRAKTGGSLKQCGLCHP